jgi:ribose transport system permease protein
MAHDRRRISLGLDRFSGLYIWALFIVVFTIWEPELFPTMATVHSIASEQSIVAILALATLIPLTAGCYDLSVGSTINFSCVVVTIMQTAHGWGMWPSILAAVAVGVVIGALNGFFVVVLGIDSFIATLGMATIVGAFQTIVSGDNQPLPASGAAWLDLTQKTIVGGFQIVFLYVIVIAVILWWALERTPAGRYLYAIGGNREAARLSGVKTGKWTWLSLVASGTLAAVGGVLFASLLGPSLTFGQGMLLPTFAAAFLGSTQFKPGRFNVWGTIVAVFVLATGVEGLQLVTGVQWLSDMFNGVALIAAVGFAVWRQRAAKSRRARASVPSADSTGGPAGDPAGKRGPDTLPTEPEARVTSPLS